MSARISLSSVILAAGEALRRQGYVATIMKKMKSYIRYWTQIGSGVFNRKTAVTAIWLIRWINFGDHYQVLADYRSYVDRDKVDEAKSSPGRMDDESDAQHCQYGLLPHRTEPSKSMPKISGIDPVRL